ncbi:hypothetical protein [Streptomyces sp. NRRL WC-3742]|uniref:hypothetical protein n=1 Tax=Streptomyces sp. NRRL WC-3742 TaxID=1463934 RepID=UPI0004C771DF|nr:hypothetical protein [Streptomyces sp. NRRL WC-3742]
MLNPATVWGALIIAIMGEAGFRILQLMISRITTLDMKSPVNVIICVAIGALAAVLAVLAIAALYLHGRPILV